MRRKRRKLQKLYEEANLHYEVYSDPPFSWQVHIGFEYDDFYLSTWLSGTDIKEASVALHPSNQNRSIGTSGSGPH